MSLEDQHTDRKSLRTVTGKTAHWDELAKDAVCFANGAGGRLLIGIEDGQTWPPADQTVPSELLDRLRKRIGELTVNVQALPTLQRAPNGGEFIELLIERAGSVASTRDGRYFLRVGLKEREGSGFDLIYDRLLSQGRPAPLPEEGIDWVKVTIQRRIAKPEVMRLMAEADARFQLTQRERITLGVLAQSEGMNARELGAVLETEGPEELVVWLGRLQAFSLVQTAGRTQGTRYFVDPDLLRGADLKVPTTLLRIEPHRLRELIREDLRRYPLSKIGEISARIGPEVNRSQLKRALAELVGQAAVEMQGARSGARYLLMVAK